MKKLFLSLFSTGLIVASVYADPVSEVKAMLEPVCSEFDLILFTDKRYQQSDMGGTVAKSYFDTKTIKIDKKNKTIDVWVSYILNASGRKSWINNVGNEYIDIGYITQLRRIFYTQNRITYTSTEKHSCNGTTINSSSNVNASVQDISPYSLDEILMNAIVKKYNLK